MYALLLLPLVFTEVTDVAGLEGFVQHAPQAPPRCLMSGGEFCVPERMTGGAAAGDFDGDGWVDLYLTRLDGPDALFRNQGDGRFVDVSADVGLGRDYPSNGAAWFDLEGDGDLDLYVTGLGVERYLLYVNEGGRFTEEGEARGAAIVSEWPHLGQSVAVGDPDRDGDLDLYVGEWWPVQLAPAGTPSHARYLRNRGDGRFEDATDSVGLRLDGLDGSGVWVFAPAFVDLDADGWPDLAQASDFRTSRLFWNEGGAFVEGTERARVGTDQNGMGSTFGDVDGDGDLDWFVTSIDDPGSTATWGTTGNRLYRNEGDRRFVDVTDRYGVRAGGWGWGAAFFDADHDGDLDLAMTNGVDYPTVETEDRFHADPMRLWRNEGPERPMAEVAVEAGLTDTGSGKGLLVFDYDRDGDLDLLVVRNGDTPRLYRNDAEGAWLMVDAPIGARVEAAGQVRVVGVGTHFLGQSEAVAHFGLGERTEPVEVVVRRLDGDVFAGEVALNRRVADESLRAAAPEPLPDAGPAPDTGPDVEPAVRARGCRQGPDGSSWLLAALLIGVRARPAPARSRPGSSVSG